MKIRFSEQILLLMLDEDTGKIYPQPGQYFDYALAGALLLELVDLGIIRLHQGYLRILQQQPLEDPALNTIMHYLLNFENDIPIESLFPDILHSVSALIPSLLNHLVQKGILEQGHNRYCWIRTPQSNPDDPYNVQLMLKNAIFNEKTPHENAVIFMGIASVTGLLTHIFRQEDLKIVYPKIARFVKFEIMNHILGNALSEFSNTFKKIIQTE